MVRSKLFCDRCGVSVFELIDGVCRKCLSDDEEIEVENLDLPEKPTTIFLRDKKVSLMGSYLDGEPRYIVSIPRDDRNNFYINGIYDIIFKLKSQKKGEIVE